LNFKIHNMMFQAYQHYFNQKDGDEQRK